MMEFGKRATGAASTAKVRMADMKAGRAERKADRAGSEAERLRMENRLLQEQVERERQERGRVLASLERLSAAAGSRPRKHRLRRFLALTTAAGAAYVAGTKAGRERYEELRARWDDLLHRPEVERLRERSHEVAGAASRRLDEASGEAAEAVRETGRRAADAVEPSTG